MAIDLKSALELYLRLFHLISPPKKKTSNLRTIFCVLLLFILMLCKDWLIFFAYKNWDRLTALCYGCHCWRIQNFVIKIPIQDYESNSPFKAIPVKLLLLYTKYKKCPPNVLILNKIFTWTKILWIVTSKHLRFKTFDLKIFGIS